MECQNISQHQRDWRGRRQADYQSGHTEHWTVSLPTATGKNQGCHYNLIYIRIRWVPCCTNALGGVEEAVEGIVGGLQIKEHLAYLTVIQLIGGWHAAEGGQPGRGKNDRKKNKTNCVTDTLATSIQRNSLCLVNKLRLEIKRISILNNNMTTDNILISTIYPNILLWSCVNIGSWTVNTSVSYILVIRNILILPGLSWITPWELSSI